MHTTSIYTPLHVHGARSEAEYRQQQRDHLMRLQTARPALGFGDPWLVEAPAEALVSGGKWIVRCACGNGPSASPAWQLALCFECGAVFEGVTFPEDAADVELALLARPQLRNRHWAAPETVADLIAENVQHGVAS